MSRDLDDRVVGVEGTTNFRDFGARESASLPLPRRRFFRSAHLGEVTDAGAAVLRTLGVATIVDLRGVDERATALPWFAGEIGAEVVSVPLEPRMRPQLARLVADGRANAAGLRDLMIDGYRGYVDERSADFATAVRAVVAACDRPLVVHCTAGKDRTGWLVALLLAAAGLDRDAILADYLATNRLWSRSVPIADGFSPEAYEPVLVADADYLASAFDRAEARDGSIEAYLARTIGLDDAARRRLEESTGIAA